MLLALFLQTTIVKTSDLNAVYIALGGTLASAIAAAIASFVASSRATKTAEKVAGLSAQTTREVAALSAQVSRESATLAARTAQELKAIDYKNGFYSKIVEKRFHAWEKAQELINPFSATMQAKRDGKILPAYFSSQQAFDDVIESIRSMTSQTLWLGKDYADHITDIFNNLVIIRNKCGYADGRRDAKGKLILDANKLAEAGKEYFPKSQDALTKFLMILGEQMKNLHDVEEYFKVFSHLGAGVDLDAAARMVEALSSSSQDDTTLTGSKENLNDSINS